MPKLYSEQFKADAVALVESGVARRQVCADLGISERVKLFVCGAGFIGICRSGRGRPRPFG
ncbi:hypothetical protein I4J35_07555 [Corynebacterium belfantii]|nr:hypothetical protein [Corynebacterium belfantii]